eukprot:scaffold4824_cov69-Phaeocystis_antarctica.AAC.3
MPTRSAESKGGRVILGEVWARRREGVCGGDVSGVHGEGPTEGWGPGHARSARRTCSPYL